MPAYRLLLIVLVYLLLIPPTTEAQRRRNQDEDSWPPQRAYSRLFLGGALQGVFERHYDFCGFTKHEGKRDYTPPTIEKFLGQRSLRTRVEKADINGGNLLSYVFSAREIAAPLDAIRFSPTNLLYAEADGIDLFPQPRPGFDAFVLTKNCGGYLKASLDAGFKPPYAAFAAALNTDASRSSSVLAMAGSFESPLTSVLAANDARTTELMARLWQFYAEHPEYLGEAYYLRQFEGVLIKHLTDSKEVSAAEQSVGINVSLPLTARVNSNLSQRRESEHTFSGTDWETVVYTDFSGPYTRASFFQRLPGPAEIGAYFANLSAVAQAPPPLREAAAHQHTVHVGGLPAALAGAGWHVENLGGDVYTEVPRLSVSPTEEGVSFTLTGNAAPALFGVSAGARVAISYELVLPSRTSMPSIRIPVREQLSTSAHPLLDLAGTRFELHRRNTGQYALQWHLTINVDDRENPLDPGGRFDARLLTIGVPGELLDARVVSSTYDARRAVLNVTLESERSWPLRMIDDRNMRTFPLEAELNLPVREGFGVCRRPITTRLAVPNIAAPATPPIPFIRPSPGPAQG
ncbi:hypothetical protein [Lewinella sp. JB7]|uniref:hypothetical protein n=1 Tax=Lewinella sp. JB7 TaxID=2962887 RepID=UPI0020C9A851|nr:hypothetical protein [Lewinella sp. JB7]MCP9235364.1 hypothetical protein [Lewinella sp. JB7]